MKQGSIKELKAVLPQEGKLEWISLRTERRGTVYQADKVEVLAGLDLAGNRRIVGKKVDMAARRQATLVQFEHLPVLASILKKEEVTPDLLMRNLLVSGINLVALKDKQFSIGDVQFEGTCYCHPCSRMEEALDEGGYNAGYRNRRGHGEITARALTSGLIKISDTIKFLKEDHTGAQS